MRRVLPSQEGCVAKTIGVRCQKFLMHSNIVTANAAAASSLRHNIKPTPPQGQAENCHAERVETARDEAERIVFTGRLVSRSTLVGSTPNARPRRHQHPSGHPNRRWLPGYQGLLTAHIAPPNLR
jgi:hypothetical protein